MMPPRHRWPISRAAAQAVDARITALHRDEVGGLLIVSGHTAPVRECTRESAARSGVKLLTARVAHTTLVIEEPDLHQFSLDREGDFIAAVSTLGAVASWWIPIAGALLGFATKAVGWQRTSRGPDGVELFKILTAAGTPEPLVVYLEGTTARTDYAFLADLAWVYASRIAGVPLLLIIAVTHDDVAWPTLTRLAERSEAELVDSGAIDAADITRWWPQASRRIVTALSQLSGGDPEIVALLVDSISLHIHKVEDTETLFGQLLEVGLDEAIGRLLRRSLGTDAALQESVFDVLVAAALCGDTFSASPVATAIARPFDEVVDLLDTFLVSDSRPHTAATAEQPTGARIPEFLVDLGERRRGTGDWTYRFLFTAMAPVLRRRASGQWGNDVASRLVDYLRNRCDDEQLVWLWQVSLLSFLGRSSEAERYRTRVKEEAVAVAAMKAGPALLGADVESWTAGEYSHGAQLAVSYGSRLLWRVSPAAALSFFVKARDWALQADNSDLASLGVTRMQRALILQDRFEEALELGLDFVEGRADRLSPSSHVRLLVEIASAIRAIRDSGEHVPEEVVTQTRRRLDNALEMIDPSSHDDYIMLKLTSSAEYVESHEPDLAWREAEDALAIVKREPGVSAGLRAQPYHVLASIAKSKGEQTVSLGLHRSALAVYESPALRDVYRWDRLVLYLSICKNLCVIASDRSQAEIALGHAKQLTSAFEVPKHIHQDIARLETLIADTEWG